MKGKWRKQKKRKAREAEMKETGRYEKKFKEGRRSKHGKAGRELDLKRMVQEGSKYTQYSTLWMEEVCTMHAKTVRR